ncbi:lycopene cyclase domain-containing protein [Gulosibacter macacae]|uniref:Lycopene cyclase domain-containing protein n=1 Tax=Gulosibacter macacae TaxID=2488791 RepID=A0A3P3VSZ2_9MICO|nr:lycopene cyclase domain-containing protein [Gulosibacter macacae]RRJ85574.1 lycopene cyclase domain-containing protein [Gulosibacter macacae]
MPEYTLATLLTMLAVILVEILWLRTGVFRTAQYWVSLLIMFSFQVLVDGWLTKLSDPIVIYAPESMLGVRFPWDIPVEDFGFGFAMLTLTIVIWKRLNRNDTGTGAGAASTPTNASAETQTD